MANPKVTAAKARSVEKTAADPVRARLDAEVKALSRDEVDKVPWLAAERVEHLKKFATSAVRDAAELTVVALPEGKLQPWEVEVLPVALHAAETLGVAVQTDQIAAGVPLSDDDATALAESRKAQKTVSWAFRRLRYRGQSAKLRELDAIEAGDPDDVSDACNDSVRLIALAEHPDQRAWFASLECGEPAALATLHTHLPRLQALAKDAERAREALARRDQLGRLWTVIGRIERRVRDAADYRYHGAPKRAEYRAFETPSEKKKKAERRAERPKKAAAKKAAKAAKKAADAEKKAAKKAEKKGEG
jgi:hypothetical protein